MSVVIDGSNGVDIGAGNLTFPDNTTQTTAPIGVGQTWQNATLLPGGRALGTTYTNSTGKPIMVSVSASASPSGGRLEFYIDNIIISQNGTASLASGVSYGAFQFIIPNGSTYKCVNGTGMVLTYWFELR